MNFQQLRYFITCSELLSFKQTANILYTTPSTVTRQIAKLEDELGIKLFIRNTHNTFVTDEGWEFYKYAMIALEQIDSFENKLISVGKKALKVTPAFLIACYTRDGTFGRVVKAIEQMLPSENLSKPYKFYYTKPGMMVDAVLDGACQVGIDTDRMLENRSDEMETMFFHRCPFRIIVGNASPLFGRDSISTKEIAQCFGNFGCFLPKQFGDSDIRETPLACAADLRSLGEYTVSLLPQIFPLFSDFSSLGDNMLILPRELTFGYSKEVSAIRLEDESVSTDYMLFWKKGEKDADLNTFLNLITRFISADQRQSSVSKFQ